MDSLKFTLQSALPPSRLSRRRPHPTRSWPILHLLKPLKIRKQNDPLLCSVFELCNKSGLSPSPSGSLLFETEVRHHSYPFPSAVWIGGSLPFVTNVLIAIRIRGSPRRSNPRIATNLRIWGSSPFAAIQIRGSPPFELNNIAADDEPRRKFDVRQWQFTVRTQHQRTEAADDARTKQTIGPK